MLAFQSNVWALLKMGVFDNTALKNDHQIKTYFVVNLLPNPELGYMGYNWVGQKKQVASLFQYDF